MTEPTLVSYTTLEPRVERELGPCFACGGTYYWLRPLDGGAVCGRCHPYYWAVAQDQISRIQEVTG